ncbi:hypothetical protein K1719_013580 [Acacia pycnantha]|nr:hypothetical protein K1719_013580 [Acacia pycnantha]
MDNSRVGEGVAYSETSRWKAVSFRKTIAKEMAQAIVVSWPQAVEGSTSLIMGLAERIEENIFASTKDEVQMLRSDRLPILSDIYRCFIFDLPVDDLFIPLFWTVYSNVVSILTLIDFLLHHSSPQNIKQTEIEIIAETKKALDEIFTFLNVTKGQIGPDFESELDEKKRHIGSFVRAHRAYSDKKGQHSTDKCSTQHAVPSQSNVFQDKLSEKQLTMPSMSLQVSHLPEQIPNENKMNPQVKSAESEQDDPEKLMQQVAEEYDISLEHEIYALIDTDESDTDPVSPQVKCPTNEVIHLLSGASGLIVELCFTGVTVSSDLMSHLVSNQMSIKPLRLRVPTNYPNSSPILLDEMPPESRDEPADPSTKAKLKLQRSLRSLDDPLLFKSIAMSWEKCVREALCDYARKFGGGTFSSKYGGWKNV